MKKFLKAAMLVIAITSATFVQAQDKDVVDVAIGSEVHSTLVTAIKAADLATALKGKGPFTIFAPINDAFAKLPAGTLDNLLLPENKAALAKVLSYHVIPGSLDSATIAATIAKNNGAYGFKTLSGARIFATMVEGRIKLTDENGGIVYLSGAGILAKNGMIHVVQGVLLPK